MRRQRNGPLSLLLFGSLVITGVLGVFVYFLATREAPSYTGSYTEGIAGNPLSLNPLLASFNDPDKDLAALLFAGLTRLDKDSAVVPDLAARWEVAGEGRSYTFQLRKNLKWHDGQALTVDDVVFTLRMLQDKDFPGNPELPALWKQVRVEKAGEESVRLTLDQPHAPLLSYTTIGILPLHKLQGVQPKALAEAEANASAVGSGPFKLREVNLDHATLEANPDYHFGRPYLEKVHLKFLKDDQTVSAALAAKQIDGGLIRPSAGVEAVERVKQNGDLDLLYLPRSSYAVLFLNNKMPPFQDRSVRQALSYAIDPARLIQEAAGGLGITAAGPISATTWAYDADLKPRTYDPQQAMRLLDESGWKANSDGIREKDGQQLRFGIVTNNDKTRVAVAEELARSMKAAGFRAEIAASGASGLMQNFVIPRKFQALLYGIDPGYDPDPYPVWHSSQTADDKLNLSGFSKPEADRLLERARTSASLEERKQAYREFQALFLDEMPSIPLYHPRYVYAMNRRIKGVETGMLYEPASRFRNIKDWYVDTQRVWVGSGG